MPTIFGSMPPRERDSMSVSPSVTVLVASLGRPEALADLLAALAGQTRPPARVLLSLTSPADAPAQVPEGLPVEIFTGPAGSCAQRNAALDRIAPDCDLIFFCDDDYLPSRFALERATAFMARHSEVSGATGKLLADGIDGPGITVAEARALIDADDAAPPRPPEIRRDHDGLYGCNMVFRAAAIGGVRFDERLPLYGWQEDVDFGARVKACGGGRLVTTHCFSGVHRGEKRGRSSGRRLGYSQVMNPAYLVNKGTMERAFARRLILRNVAANLWRSVRPEPWVDRRGRLHGNMLALVDLAWGRVTPERIVAL